MLSRGVEYRDGIEGKQPQFMDLANSCYIEELADVVIMVHRPEFYRIYESEIGYNLRGMMEVYVKKNNLNILRKLYYRYDEDTGKLTSATIPKQKKFYIDNMVLDDEELPF
jgi:replicative DNA helicase